MRAHSSVMCVLLGLVAGCGDADDANEQLGSERELLDQQADTSSEQGATRGAPTEIASTDPGVVGCPGLALAPDGKCEPRPTTGPCPLVDPDCERPVTDAGQIACAPVQPANGQCEFTGPFGPCGNLDPDCGPVGPVCTAIWKEPDGKCDLTDPCARVQDADCQPSGGCTVPPSPPQPRQCPAIPYDTNGSCEPPPGCEWLDADDCRRVPPSPPPRQCPAIPYDTNGSCEPPPGCEWLDADDCRRVVGLACPAILIPPDGVCPPDNPCDPDCPRGNVASPATP